jgi:hypothetical protein
MSTVRNCKKPKKSSNSGINQNSNKNQNINKSQIHNQAKGTIGQVESEVQSLGDEVTNKSGYWCGQTSQNGKENLGENFESNKKGQYNDLRFKTYEKGPFSIHLKVKRPDTPLVEGKRKRGGASLISSMLWLNPRSVSNPPDNMLSLFGKCPQRKWKQIKLWTALSFKIKG